MSLDDAVKSGARDGAQAGFLAALRSPEGRDLLRSIMRDAVADIVPRLRRLDQLKAEFGIPPSTARMWIRQKKLRATRIGRVVLVDVSQLRPYSDEEITQMAAEARR